MKILYWILLSCLPLCCAADTVLSDFDDEQALTAWTPLEKSTVTLRLNRDPQYISDGRGSGIFSTPALSSGESQWPRITLNFVGTKLPRDWSNYQVLRLTVFNPSDEPVPLGMQLRFNGGLRLDFKEPGLPPGRSEISWELPEVLVGATVDSLLVLHSLPPKPYTLYLDELRLGFSNSVLDQRIKDLRKQVKAENISDDPQIESSFKALDAELAQLTAAGDAPEKRSAKLSAVRNKFNRQQNILYQAGRDRQIAQLHTRFPQLPWGYGWANSLVKVYRTERPFPGSIGGTPELALARNEGESLQIALLAPKQAIHAVQARVGDLKTADGRKLNATRISIHPEGYLKTLRSVYPTDNVVWRPDVVLEHLGKIELDAQAWQPFWVDVETSFDTRPGEYTGKIIFSGDSVPDLAVPIKITVWDFALPRVFTQPNVFSYQTDASNHRIYTNDAAAWNEFNDFLAGRRTLEQCGAEARRLRQIELDTELLLQRHHITPAPLYCAHRQLKLEDAERWLARGGNYFNIDYVHPQTVKNAEPYPDSVRRVLLKRLAGVVPELRRRGLSDRAFLYAFDEVRENQFFAARQILSEIKASYPELPIVTTAFDSSYGRDNGLEKCIDIWVPTIERFMNELPKVREVQKSGKKVWFYTCAGGKDQLDFLIETPWTAPRLLTGLAQHKFQADGFLYYSTTNWEKKTIVTQGPLTEHNGRSYQSYNGCGLLLYPGPGQALPSIRLKAVRDGLEDHEYIRLLQKLMLRQDLLSEADQQLAKQLLAVDPAVLDTIYSYDRTGKLLNAERQRAGQLLSRHAGRLQAL